MTNRRARNALGHPTGYALLPGENAVPFAQPDSWVRKRAALPQFAPLGHALPAGGNVRRRRLPNQSRGGDGLPNGPPPTAHLHNQDVVLWYNHRASPTTHVPKTGP